MPLPFIFPRNNERLRQVNTKRIIRPYKAINIGPILSKALATQTEARKIAESLDIPLIKACQVVASFELGRRFFTTTSQKPITIRTAKEAYEYLKDMRDLPKEYLRGLYLNSHYRLIHDEVISIGSLNSNIIHPREVFKPALDYSASAVILAHNHPSGIKKPSQPDITITKQLKEAGTILGIELLDHIIIVKNSFVSIPELYNKKSK